MSIAALGWMGPALLSLNFLWPTQIADFSLQSFWLNYVPLLITWCSLSGVMTYWALLYIGHFTSLHPIPERSQIFTLMVTLLATAVLAKFLLLLSFHVEILRYREIILLSPIPALITFWFEYASGRAFIKSGRKRLAFTALLRREREALETVLRDYGLIGFYELVDSSVLPHSLSNPADIHWIAISRPRVREFVESSPILLAYNMGIPVFDHVALKNWVTGRISTEQYDSWAFLVQATRIGFAQRLYRESRPWVERMIALVLLLLFLPLLVFIGVLVKVSDGGPIFYRQIRLGFRGSTFEIIKFRSMRTDAEAAGPTWAAAKDPRVTPLGNLLRKTRLDELPQLWNVMRGQMTFIGPRPERPEFHEKLKADVPHFDLRLLLRPGITGWSQVMGGYAASIDDSRIKLEFDLFYLQNMSLRIDLVILFRTIFIVLGGQEFKSKRGLVQKPSNDH